MAFENVDADRLKNAVDSCINCVNYERSLELVNIIGNDNVWNTSSRTHLKDSMVKLTDKRFEKLNNKLSVAQRVAELILKYKKLEKENRGFRNELDALRPKLYYEEDYISGYVEDDDGNQIAVWSTRTVKDSSVESKMNDLNGKIRNNEEKMSKIHSDVATLVGGM